MQLQALDRTMSARVRAVEGRSHVKAARKLAAISDRLEKQLEVVLTMLQ